MIEPWLEALHDWEVAALLRFYAYPLVNAAHIFSIGLLVGSIVPADLRMLGFFAGVPAAPFLRLMTAFAATGLALAITTGFLLFSVQPHEYAGNPAFLTKIGLVAIGATSALVVRFGPGWRAAMAGGGVSPALKAAAFLSIAIWVCALLAGRWIAFL